jgi:hypothetical protein
MRLLSAAIFCLSVLSAAEKYTGPRPPKADIPYLVHADNLVETEVAEAREETRKDATTAVLPGAASHARTPLAEPIFLLRAEKLVPERIQAYKLEVKNGNREVTISQKRSRNASRPIFLNVTRLGDGLYKIEVDQMLENGQYCLSPEGSNTAFSFEVY